VSNILSGIRWNYYNVDNKRWLQNSDGTIQYHVDQSICIEFIEIDWRETTWKFVVALL
jgi:hypothetical protein